MRTREKKFISALRPGGAIVVLLALLAACGAPSSGRSDSGSKASQDTPRSSEARAVFGPSGGSKPGGAAESDSAWTIVVATVPAEGGDLAALRSLSTVRGFGLADARIEKRGKGTAIAYGSYSSPTDPQAQQDLERIQSIESNGQFPFQGAMLVPPPFDPQTGSIPELDLSTVRARFGKNAMYTLQVAVYERSDGQAASASEMAEFRRAAEQAAAQFRADGEDAYYYHGPRRSMVTIGVFGPKDYADQPISGGRTRHIESAALRLLREKHPYNLVNGQALRVKSSAYPDGRVQPSFVVAIPD